MGPARLRAAVDDLAARCVRYQRDIADLRIVCGSRLVLDPAVGALEQQAEQLIGSIRALEGAGATHVNVGIRADDEAGILSGLALYGRLVLPALD
jgi:hypothetical protein